MNLLPKNVFACYSRRLLTFMALCFIANSIYAQLQETTDKIKISEIKIAPGGDAVYFDVSLEGSSTIYNGYEVTLQLPEGLDVDYYNDALDVSMRKTTTAPYPYSEDRDGNKTYTHSVSSSFGSIGDGKLKVMCYSSQNENFTSVSGDLFRVYVKASPYMKPGEAKITSSDVIFTTSEKVGYSVASADFTVNVSNTSTVSLSVAAANQWGSCILPFAAEIPSGVMAYTYGSEDGDYIILNEASSMEAFKPYILYAEGGYSGTLSGEVNASNYTEVATDGMLNGALVRQQITEGYVMQNKGNGVMFYNVNGHTFSIPAGRCWLSASSSDAKQSFGFAFQTDGIENVNVSSFSPSHVVYSLDGHRVFNPRSGCIYIIGGKKVLKK